MSVFLFILLKKLAWVLGGYLVAFLAMLPPPLPAKRPPPWWGLFQDKPPKAGRWIEPERRPMYRDSKATELPTISGANSNK